MNYFNPKDLTQLQGTYNYTAMSGVGFGVTEANERIFLNARTVDTLKLNVGDVIRVWAVDNYANADTNHYPSRWRAIRAEIITRLEDSVADLPHVSDAPAPQPVAVPLSAPAPTTTLGAALSAALETINTATPAEATDLLDYILDAIDDGVPVTARVIADEAVAQGYVHSGKTELSIAVNNKLQALHARGEVALLKIYSKGGKDAAAVYYGKTINVLKDHLDAPLVGDQ